MHPGHPEQLLLKNWSVGLYSTGGAFYSPAQNTVICMHSLQLCHGYYCRSVGATVVEMLTGRRPFAEYNEKMAVIFGLGQKSLSLDNLIQGPGFSDEVQVFLKLCINW